MTAVTDQPHPVGQANLPDMASLVQQIETLTAQVQACNMMALVAQNTDNAVIVTDAHGQVLFNIRRLLLINLRQDFDP